MLERRGHVKSDGQEKANAHTRTPLENSMVGLKYCGYVQAERGRNSSANTRQ